MKGYYIFVWVLCLSMIMCSCSSASESVPVSQEFIADNSQESSEISQSDMQVYDITDMALGENYTSLDQILFIEEYKKLYTLSRGKGISKISRIDLCTRSEKTIMTKPDIVRFDSINNVIYAFRAKEFVVTEFDGTSSATNDYAIKKDLNIMSSRISFDQQQIVNFDDNHIILSPLSSSGEAQKIPIDCTGRIISVQPLNTTLYVLTVIDEGQREILLVDKSGSILGKEEYDNCYVSPFENGVLLHQGQEANISNKLYIINVRNKVVLELLTAEKLETNAANISYNGEWVITAEFEEKSSVLSIRLYDVQSQKYRVYEVPHQYFVGTPNIIGGSDSLFIDNSGTLGGIRILDDEGFKLYELKFPTENVSVLPFASKEITSNFFKQ